MLTKARNRIIEGSFVNVKDFGAVGDGVTDDAAAIQAAINSIPNFTTGYASVGGYSSGGNTVVFPAGNYLIASQVTISATKNVSIVGQSGWGARITGSVDHAFLVDASGSGTFGFVEFNGLAFDETGIEISSNRRGTTAVRRCVFTDAPNNAIYGNGASIVGITIEENKFTGCAGGCSFTGLDVDLLDIRHNTFVRGHTNPDIDLGSYSAKVEFNDFETRLVADATVPWVRLLRGGNRILHNRFGDETVSTTYAPPRDAIQIGPDTPDGVPVQDTIIEGNKARGTNGTPSSTQAASFIRINAPISNCRFADNIVAEAADYYTAVFHEAYVDAIPATAGKSYSNIARGNLKSLYLTCPIFSHDGFGVDWSDRPGSDAFTSRQNLVRQSNDLTQSLWIKTNISVAKDAIGPDGAANSACTLTKGSTGSSSVRSQLIGTANNVDGNVVVSVWLKKGTISRAQVYLVNTTDSYVMNNQLIVDLFSDWRRHDLTFSDIDPSKSYFVYIGPAGLTSADLAATGTILAFQPSAFNGYDAPDRPAPNVDTGGAQHAAPQFNSLVLGDRYVGYGSAAPSSGRYEQGDMVFNTAPSAAGKIGWVCVTSGSPGTWKPFGAIDA